MGDSLTRKISLPTDMIQPNNNHITLDEVNFRIYNINLAILKSKSTWLDCIRFHAFVEI